jgi:hypothetical protein
LSGGNAQWIAHDDTNCYITQPRTLWKIPTTVNLNNATRKIRGVKTIDIEDISDLWSKGYDHFGDLDYAEYDGRVYLFIPIEDDKRKAPSGTVVFEATTLYCVGYSKVGLKGAPWCAIHKQLYILNSTYSGEIKTLDIDWNTLKTSGYGWLISKISLW